MRGMGGGYTQILIDGQRMAPGFSLDSIAPEQIEKIEIMRAPVAEFGTRAIAGTINVVMRSDFKRKANEFKFGGGADGSRPQVGASWSANGQADTLGYNLSATAFQGGQDSVSDTRTLGLDADGDTVLDQRVHSSGDSTRRGLFVNGRLQWRLGPGESAGPATLCQHGAQPWQRPGRAGAAGGRRAALQPGQQPDRDRLADGAAQRQLDHRHRQRRPAAAALWQPAVRQQQPGRPG